MRRQEGLVLTDPVVHLAAMGLDVQLFAHGLSGAAVAPNLVYAENGRGLYPVGRLVREGC